MSGVSRYREESVRLHSGAVSQKQWPKTILRCEAHHVFCRRRVKCEHLGELCLTSSEAKLVRLEAYCVNKHT